MSNASGFSATVRAGRAILAALAARTGPRPRDGRSRLMMPLALLGAAGLGAVGGAALATDGPGPALGTADRARIEAVVRDYILAHPEIIPEAMRKLQEKRVAQSVDDSRSGI